MADPLIVGGLIAAGGSVLGSYMSNRSNQRIAANSGRVAAQLDLANRNWQDRNHYNSFVSQFGEDNVGGSIYYPTVYGNKGADLLGRDRDLEYSAKHMDQAFDKLGERGLTPQEIAGSPVPGGSRVSGGNNVLTNAVSSSHANLARDRTAAFQSRLNSETQIATSKIQADAHIKGKLVDAGINVLGQRNSANISKYSVDTGRKNVLDRLKLQDKLNTSQIRKISSQIAAIKQDTDFKRILHSERWERLFSTMSADNVLASVFAVNSGLDIEEVLKGVSPSDRNKLTNFIMSVSGSKSTIRSELTGTSGVMADLINIFKRYTNKLYDRFMPLGEQK